ncbi:hypothetical protein VA249_27800 [Vibrio alfacsensis]|nr:hypothetical protein VA249_27800 [Vibrio alfacsensis]
MLPVVDLNAVVLKRLVNNNLSHAHFALQDCIRFALFVDQLGVYIYKKSIIFTN